MDKIWDRKSFKVGGHWPLWWGWKKRNDHAEPTKVERLKNKNKKTMYKYTDTRCYLFCLQLVMASTGPRTFCTVIYAYNLSGNP